MPADKFVKLTLNDFAGAVEDVLRQISAAAVLVGHSMGGVIAQIVASRNPVVSLVLVASGKTRPERPHYPRVPTDSPFVLTREHARTLLFHEISERAFEEIFSKLVPESPTAMNDYTVGGVVDASTVRCPVLVIAAEFDRDQSLAAAADAIAAYRATGIRVRGAGHDLLLEDGTEFVASYLHCWLEVHGSRRIDSF
jgi:pimeloyl-ACP methyl ester carboxylesterase